MIKMLSSKHTSLKILQCLLDLIALSAGLWMLAKLQQPSQQLADVIPHVMSASMQLTWSGLQMIEAAAASLHMQLIALCGVAHCALWFKALAWWARAARGERTSGALLLIAASPLVYVLGALLMPLITGQGAAAATERMVAAALIAALWAGGASWIYAKRSAVDWLTWALIIPTALLISATQGYHRDAAHELAHYYTLETYDAQGYYCSRSQRQIPRWLHRLPSDAHAPLAEIKRLDGRQYFFGPHKGDPGSPLSL